MKTKALTPLLTLTLLALAACGGNTTAAETSAQQTNASSPTSTRATAEETSPSAAATATETGAEEPDENAADCREQTAETAVNQNIGKVPQRFPDQANQNSGTSWVPFNAEDTYNACEDLSYVVLGLQGGTVSSPFQIMLFHRGQYIGTPAKISFGFAPAVEQVNSGEIAVTYSYPDEGQPNAAARPQATSHFTYNSETGGVDHSGQWPANTELDEHGWLPIDPLYTQGAPTYAGGDVSGGATAAPITEGTVSAVKTADGSVVCALDSAHPQASGCYSTTARENGAGSWVTLGDGQSKPAIAAQQEATAADTLAEQATVIGEGETLYSGDQACTVSDGAVTCWTMNGYQGVFIKNGQYYLFPAS